MHLAASDFADEFQVLARCEARLFISRLETGLVCGLGAPSWYYPYRPVGEIRRAMATIRAKRAQGNIVPGLFLMMGTAHHMSTRHAFQWLFQEVVIRGLPEGVRIVACGSGTESLLPVGVTVPGLDLRGWVEQTVLDELLCRAQGVLVPHMVGFGALTKLPELSLAGVPVITSQHPLRAMDLPPGITVVDDCWGSWESALLELMQTKTPPPAAAYDTWESTQMNTLDVVVRQLLSNSSGIGLAPGRNHLSQLPVI